MKEKQFPIEINLDRVEAQFNIIGLCIEEKWPMPFVEKFYTQTGSYYYRILFQNLVFEILPGAILAIDTISHLAVKIVKNNQPRVYRISQNYDPNNTPPITEIFHKSSLTGSELENERIYRILAYICKYCAYYERRRKKLQRANQIVQAINSDAIISDLPKKFLNRKYFAEQENYWQELYRHLKA